VSGQPEWVGGPGRPGWLGRLVTPGDPRPPTTAFLLAAAAAVAFVVSLASDWMSVTASIPNPVNGDGTDAISVYGAEISGFRSGTITLAASNNVTNLTMLGLIYGVGALALLTAAGAVLARPDLALRIRMAVAALGVGVVAMVVAAAFRMPSLLLVQGAAYAGNNAPKTLAVSYQPGLFCAFAVGVLPVAAVWLRSRPAARAAQAGYARAGLVKLPPISAPADLPEGPAAAAGPAEPEAWSRPGMRETAAGWQRAAEPTEPYDLTVTPEG
jgi:hypothetical protein